MSGPLVTVLMPVFNGEPYLAESIESILHQTFRDYEFVIINDGSTDASAATIERYRRRDGRIRACEQSNRGLAATLNRGLELAKGRYVARMDQDDISLAERLAEQVAFMEAKPDVGICGAWVETFEPSGRTVLQLPTESELIRSWLLFESVLPHPSVIMRQKTLAQQCLSYDVSCLYAEDYDLWVRSSRCTALANVPKVLLRYRLHGSQIVRKYEDAKLASAKQVRRHQLEWLGLTPTETELDLHQALSTWRLEARTDFIETAHRWLVKLKQANEVSGVYQPTALASVIGQRWTAVCRRATHLGLWTAKRFLGSPLRTSDAMSPIELTKMMVKCMIRQKQYA